MMGTPIKGKTYSMAPTPEGEEHPNIMVTDLRKAAKQALEALDQLTDDVDGTGLNSKPSFDSSLDAITALRAALAQPDPAEVRQGWEYMREKGLLQETWNEHPIDTDTTRGPMLMTVGDTLARAGFIKKPKPLTEERIWTAYQRQSQFHPAAEPRLASDLVKFARAIERAHGIGGEE